MLSKRLAPIRHLAQNREDEAARRFAESQQALARHEAQLQEMERYLQEYGNSENGAPIAPALLANRDAFLRQLSEALRWQAGAVKEARNRLALAREVWVGKHRDTDVLQHLIERSHQGEQRQHERLLQRELDGFAQQVRPTQTQG